MPPVPVVPPVGVTDGVVAAPGVVAGLVLVGAVVESGRRLPGVTPGVFNVLPGAFKMPFVALFGVMITVEGAAAPPVERPEGTVPAGVVTDVPLDGVTPPEEPVGAVTLPPDAPVGDTVPEGAEIVPLLAPSMPPEGEALRPGTTSDGVVVLPGGAVGVTPVVGVVGVTPVVGVVGVTPVVGVVGVTAV